MKLPILEPPYTDEAALRCAMQTGFCRVRVPADIYTAFTDVVDAGVRFFRQPEEVKNKWNIRGNNEVTNFGYANRQHEENPQQVQVFHMNYDSRPEPFVDADAITHVGNYFKREIAIPIMERSVEVLGLPNNKYNFRETFDSFTLVYYDGLVPEQDYSAGGITPHRDFGLVTVLCITKPGLEVMNYETGEYERIDPLENTVIVNYANAFELMTGGKCRSALHRVQPVDYERMSFTLFIDGTLNTPLVNLETDEVLYSTFKEYMDIQVEYYRKGKMNKVQN